jgi:NADH-quinone oxidoreductase subunit M
MTLLALIFLPLAGGLAAWIAGGFDARAPRWIALGTLAAHAAMALRLLRIALPVQGPATHPVWVRTFDVEWVPSLGIHFSLGADTLSALMIALTSFLGLAALGAGWRSFARGAGAYCFLLLASLAGVCGVFAATDLFLFFVFYEAMLIPMYFMIAMWGGKDGGPAAIKFTVFTRRAACCCSSPRSRSHSSMAAPSAPTRSPTPISCAPRPARPASGCSGRSSPPSA